jgi:hypothetical protein
VTSLPPTNAAYSVAAPVALLVALFLGFHIGSPPEGESPRSGSRSTERFHETPAERRHANCTRAEITVGAPSKIVFSIACHAPRHGDTLGFSLTRGDNESLETPGIRMLYSPSPPEGAGSGQTVGQVSAGQLR